jgi:hypothetical protein
MVRDGAARRLTKRVGRFAAISPARDLEGAQMPGGQIKTKQNHAK